MITLNELMRGRRRRGRSRRPAGERHGAVARRDACSAARPPLARSRRRRADEIRDFARAPGFQPTLRWTTGVEPALGLDQIRVPVRIAAGTRDMLLGGLTAPRFAAAIPGAELVALPGCGHVPFADDPAGVAAAILEFTAGAAPAAAGELGRAA
jgi:pimeloyl-ACP methyl ester carboxylesterase